MTTGSLTQDGDERAVPADQRRIAQCGSNGEESFLFTSESVGVGHPDKLCDIVCDAILDAYLTEDPFAKVSCEAAAKTGLIMLLGKVESTARIDYEQVARNTILRIGYDDSSKGFDGNTCNVLLAITHSSSPRSERAYKNGEVKVTASDQGLMFGYATDETPECMPLTLLLAHRLTARYQMLRESSSIPWARPDAKSQVTVAYKFENGACVPLRLHSIVMSVQHSPDISLEKLRKQLLEEVVLPVCPSQYIDDKTQVHLNPCGTFWHGGPMGDAGLTGRKIIVDTYGGWGAHGGGSFSGKDPSKMDRSAAYAARWIAKSLVVAGLCRRVLIQIAYGIGSVDPVSLTIFSYGTSLLSEAELLDVVKSNFNLRAGAIINELNLRRPIYRSTSENGHFGHEDFPWEKAKKLIIPPCVAAKIRGATSSR
ncbi:protein sams a [Trichuris trichiura]|uniref:S-adenosylmethionine synthase n=1 Tax=Trichuris trichiura TaxID=36087 RepID=A0A077ZAZ7_TRITR|nr:protein sams a [Trichuris trichiura]